MSEPIMFRGREVVAVKTEKLDADQCVKCVGYQCASDACMALPPCVETFGRFYFQYARPAKRKVVKFTVCDYYAGKSCFWFFAIINGVECVSKEYASLKSAIRGARRFCAAIGYECEIVKGDK